MKSSPDTDTRPAVQPHSGALRSSRPLSPFVILSVGLLGIVSLQAMAKTSQHLAIQHTRAVTIADAIVERIRVNPGAMADYNIGTTFVGGGTSNTGQGLPRCGLHTDGNGRVRPMGLGAGAGWCRRNHWRCQYRGPDSTPWLYPVHIGGPDQPAQHRAAQGHHPVAGLCTSPMTPCNPPIQT